MNINSDTHINLWTSSVILSTQPSRLHKNYGKKRELISVMHIKFQGPTCCLDSWYNIVYLIIVVLLISIGQLGSKELLHSNKETQMNHQNDSLL